MTKNELIKALDNMGGDDIVVIGNPDGWSNIETVEKVKGDCSIYISEEKYPVFSDN